MAKILIVEDEKPMANILGKELKKLDHELEFAYDGQEGIEKVKTFAPDLILLDLILPKASGFEVLEKVKADPDTAAVPVIVLSNLGTDDDIKRAIKLGAIDYYVKAQHPLLELIEKISEFLATPRSPIQE